MGRKVLSLYEVGGGVAEYSQSWEVLVAIAEGLIEDSANREGSKNSSDEAEGAICISKS